VQKIKEEVRRFTELQIEDEEALQELLQRLIERIDIELDGGIDIYNNFGNLLSQGV
jgi:diadenosine tetraphosphate (Ap4A) HIT family hydrolase